MIIINNNNKNIFPIRHFHSNSLQFQIINWKSSIIQIDFVEERRKKLSKKSEFIKRKTGWKKPPLQHQPQKIKKQKMKMSSICWGINDSPPYSLRFIKEGHWSGGPTNACYPINRLNGTKCTHNIMKLNNAMNIHGYYSYNRDYKMNRKLDIKWQKGFNIDENTISD